MLTAREKNIQEFRDREDRVPLFRAREAEEYDKEDKSEGEKLLSWAGMTSSSEDSNSSSSDEDCIAAEEENKTRRAAANALLQAEAKARRLASKKKAAEDVALLDELIREASKHCTTKAELRRYFREQEYGSHRKQNIAAERQREQIQKAICNGNSTEYPAFLSSSTSSTSSIKHTVTAICSAYACENAAPLICTGCNVCNYCSKVCQKAHWRAAVDGHKMQCVAYNDANANANRYRVASGNGIPTMPEGMESNQYQHQSEQALDHSFVSDTDIDSDGVTVDSGDIDSDFEDLCVGLGVGLNLAAEKGGRASASTSTSELTEEQQQLLIEQLSPSPSPSPSSSPSPTPTPTPSPSPSPSNLLAMVLQRIHELEQEINANHQELRYVQSDAASEHTYGNNDVYRRQNNTKLYEKMKLNINERNKDQARNRQLVQYAMMEANSTVGSKALPGQYHYKADAAHNAATSAIRHHFGAGGGGSHYHMAGSKQFQKGLRLDGIVSRHSRQAAVRNGKKSKANKQKSATNLGMLGQT